MDLLQWKERYGRRALDDLAQRCGSSGEYFSQIAHGHRRASHVLARKIEVATDGIVPKEVTRPDIFGPKPEPAGVSA